MTARYDDEFDDGTAASEADIVHILEYMSAAWPRHEMSEQTVAVYVIQLLRSRLPADVLLLAAMALVDTSTFFPSVAEWRTEADQIQSYREFWKRTANYLSYGEECRLRLPPQMEMMVLKRNRLLERGNEESI